MAKEFGLEILTPGRVVASGQASEVVLPAYDGERGVLAEHENFIGILGTGAVKVVQDGNDHWYLVSRGVYHVKQGSLTLFAESAETAAEINLDSAKEGIAQYEQAQKDQAKSSDYNPAKIAAERLAFEQNSARLEISRRTQLN